jgi:uncharacterized protein YcfJ
MKTLLAAAAIGVMSTTVVSANERFLATVTSIEPQYQTNVIRNPYQVCETVDIPIYGNVGGGANAGDVLGGMIIGGLLGKGASGDDKGAAAGAVIGGMIAADKKQQQGVVGYRQEQRCSTQYKEERVQTLKNYLIWYEWKGVTGRSYTYNQYSIGDRVPVSVSITAK